MACGCAVPTADCWTAEPSRHRRPRPRAQPASHHRGVGCGRIAASTRTTGGRPRAKRRGFGPGWTETETAEAPLQVDVPADTRSRIERSSLSTSGTGCAPAGHAMGWSPGTASCCRPTYREPPGARHSQRLPDARSAAEADIPVVRCEAGAHGRCANDAGGTPRHGLRNRDGPRRVDLVGRRRVSQTAATV